MSNSQRSMTAHWTLSIGLLLTGCQGMVAGGSDDNSAAVSAPTSIFAAGATPADTSANDSGSVELGVKFRSDVPGSITGIRFYKGSGNSGTHIGNLWSRTGTKLASAIFTSESASGWQQVNFATPVTIVANTTYVASYFAPQGHYAYNAPFFTTGVDNPPLHALADGVDGGDGVFAYGSSSAFPNQTFHSSNYWVDVLFVSSAAPPPASTTNASIWPASATPVNAAANDSYPVELGVKFRSDVAGSITGLRFYKGSGNNGTHVGNLWSRTGTKLASATFSSETASGWQQVNFANAVAITANTTYVASYFAPQGHYAYDRPFFTTGVDNPPLHALADGADGTNGVYLYGASSGFPTQSYLSSNYWVDVVFASSTSSMPGAPTVSITSPWNGATFAPGANITIQAAASAASGLSISKVVFSQGATALCTATTNPFNCAWNNVAAGNYSLTATATDSAGASTTSAAISLAVQATQGVSVAISPSNTALSPSAKQTFTATVTGSTNTAVTWAASGGSISGTGSSVTYTAPSANGTYTVTATSAADSTKMASATVTVTATSVAGFQGYGANATGGSTVVHVTNLNANGTGSFANAVASSGNHVVFDVGGTISGSFTIAANTFIDGFSAPSPGITFTNGLGSGQSCLYIHSSNVIVQGVRVRSCGDKDIESYGSSGAISNIVIDHVELLDSSDEDLATTNAHDYTLSWSIIGNNQNSGCQLIAFDSYHITDHHNIFYNCAGNDSRVPLIATGNGCCSTGAVVDIGIISDVEYNVSSRFLYGITAVDDGITKNYGNIANNYLDGQDPDHSRNGIDIMANGHENYFLAGNASFLNSAGAPSSYYVSSPYGTFPVLTTNSLDCSGGGYPGCQPSTRYATPPVTGACAYDNTARVTEWNNVIHGAGVVSHYADDATTAAVRSGITPPSTNLFNSAWNKQTGTCP